jgi:hypothetical protein
MNRILYLLVLLTPLSVQAAITGPTSSIDGNFSLSWNYQLREVSSSGSLLANYPGSSWSFSRSPGNYYFKEEDCTWIPYIGNVCYTVSTLQVSVSVNGSFPEGAREQSEYDYQIRSGDFDSNGLVDLYVERLTAGPADGSMQSNIVWNNTN